MPEPFLRPELPPPALDPSDRSCPRGTTRFSVSPSDPPPVDVPVPEGVEDTDGGGGGAEVGGWASETVVVASGGVASGPGEPGSEVSKEGVQGELFKAAADVVEVIGIEATEPVGGSVRDDCRCPVLTPAEPNQGNIPGGGGGR